MLNNYPDFLSGRSESLVALHNLSASCRPLFMSAGKIQALKAGYETKVSWQGDMAKKECLLKPRATVAERQAWASGLGSALFVLLSDFFQVPIEELRSTQRGSSHVARIRQFGMYIAHTMFGLSMSEVAHAFNRERTTIKHACHLIEDMREDTSFDRSVSSFEYLIRTIYPDAGGLGDE